MIGDRSKQVKSAQKERDEAIDIAEVILLKLDMKGRVVLVNRCACSLLGWTADELIGRVWWETCLPSRIHDELKGKFDDIVSGSVSIVENPIVTKSGEERMIEWRNQPLRTDKGDVTTVLRTARPGGLRSVIGESVLIKHQL